MKWVLGVGGGGGGGGCLLSHFRVVYKLQILVSYRVFRMK